MLDALLILGYAVLALALLLVAVLPFVRRLGVVSKRSFTVPVLLLVVLSIVAVVEGATAGSVMLAGVLTRTALWLLFISLAGLAAGECWQLFRK